MPQYRKGRPVGTGKGHKKYPRVQITLPPDVLALIDAQDGNRSTLIATLITERYGTGA